MSLQFEVASLVSESLEPRRSARQVQSRNPSLNIRQSIQGKRDFADGAESVGKRGDILKLRVGRRPRNVSYGMLSLRL
jgi:hypothetical protein